MDTPLDTDLFCLVCNQEQVHRVTISDGSLDEVRCLACGMVTPARPLLEAVLGPVPEPLPAVTLGRLRLGQGARVLEGSIQLPDAPFMAQAAAAMRAARSAREWDCRVLRLLVHTPEQVRLVTTLKAATDLPVLVDIGPRISLARHVAHSQADGLIFTCPHPAVADDVGNALAADYSGLVVVRTWGGDVHFQAGVAALAAQALCRCGHRHVAVTPHVSDALQFATVTRLLRQRLSVPLRAELPMAGEADAAEIATAVALGVACQQPELALASLPPFRQANLRIYDAAQKVIALLDSRDQEGQDRLGILVHMASRAARRVVTKPVRLMHEFESAPEVFVRLFPSRVVTKPQRVMGELQRLLHKIS